MPVSRLEDVAMLRTALEMLSRKLDGKQAAAKTVTRKRAVFYNALDYAVELKALAATNLHEVSNGILRRLCVPSTYSATNFLRRETTRYTRMRERRPRH
jgi:hypothetical protein